MGLEENNYAEEAGNADTVDGKHASDLGGISTLSITLVGTIEPQADSWTLAVGHGGNVVLDWSQFASATLIHRSGSVPSGTIEARLYDTTNGTQIAYVSGNNQRLTNAVSMPGGEANVRLEVRNSDASYGAKTLWSYVEVTK